MRYPVGKDTADYLKNWYDAQGFGVKTSYGYHEAIDLNLRTGGNTDLGQPVFAIAAGEVSSLHDHATGFGRHIHVYHPEYKVWSHYAHLQDIQVVPGQQVREGQQIGTLGSSGNSAYAHLHFAIKNQPTGVDGIARTQEDLAKWEDPTRFLAKYVSGNQGDMADTIPVEKTVFENLVKKSSAYDELVKRGITQERFDQLQRELDGEREALKALKTDTQNFIDRVASLLGSTADKEGIIKFATNLGTSLDQALEWKDKYEREVQEHKKSVLSYDEKLGHLDTRLTQMEEEHEVEIELLQEKHAHDISLLRQQIEQALSEKKVAESALIVASKFAGFWKLLARIGVK